MRPVSAEHEVTQAFGSLATAGVVPDWNGTPVQQLVAQYGNYQPYGHAGEDIGCPVGTPVYASKAGTVVWCDWDVNLPGGPNDYNSRWFFYKAFGGRILLIQHDDGTFAAYCHLSAFKVGNGQRVNEGDLIALSGDSSAGRDGALGAHLHREYLIDTSYSTGGGLIYGRTDPSLLDGDGALAPAGDITPQEDELSDTQVERIINEINEANEAKHVATRAKIDDAVKSINWNTQQQVEAVGRVTQQLIIDNAKPDVLVDQIVAAGIAKEVADELAKRLAS